MNILNPEQRQAIEHDNGPLLIIAGAGTGKTTVIANRFAWLVANNKAKNEEILAITFTDAATTEMEERINSLLPYGYVDLWVNTFHGMCQKILQTHALDIGLSNNFKVLNTTQTWQIVYQNLSRFKLNYYKPLGNPTKFIHSLIQHFSRIKDEGVSVEDYLRYAETYKLNQGLDLNLDEESLRIQEIAQAYETYQNLLLENNFLDFGDLIIYTLKLFKTRPIILNKYRQQFKYILVDEFQDTNWCQYELLKLLAIPRNNITVVGDDDQSIYKFRGASLSNILQFSIDFPNRQEIFLTQNYRSKQNILDLAYNFIQHNNPNRFEFQNPAKNNKRLLANSGGDGTIKYFVCDSAQDEASLVIQKIVELKNNQPDTTWSNFAILIRANDYAKQFIPHLDSANIPYRFLACKGLYNKPLILDILAYLRVLDNYHESTAMWRVLNWKLWEISDQDLINVSHYAHKKNLSLYEVCQKIYMLPQIIPSVATKFLTIIDNIIKHTGQSRDAKVSQLFLTILQDTGYLKYLSSLPAADQNLQFNYLHQFFKHIKHLEELGPDTFGLADFINIMNLELESGDEGSLDFDIESGPDMVNIMTIHAAKGLEFKHVFIVNMVERRFPSMERENPIPILDIFIREKILENANWHLEEERRLLYVAVTRAKESVFFLMAKNYGGSRVKKPSIFLYELGLEGKQEMLNLPDIFSTPKIKFKISETDLKTSAILPNYFSYTQLKSFETCPYQYRYAHILRIPVFGKATFSFGKTMHLTLQLFFQFLQDRSKAQNQQSSLFENNTETLNSSQNTSNENLLNKLLKIYSESWIDDWYSSKEQQEEYKKKGERILKEFYELHKNKFPKTKYLEIGFKLKLDDYTIKGQIDRIDEVEGGVEIVDYKTGNVPKDIGDIDKDQLLIYQMASESVLKEKTLNLTFYYLDQNKPVSFLGTEDDLVKLQSKIVKTINDIKTSDFKATPSVIKCKSCDYKDICEFRQL